MALLAFLAAMVVAFVQGIGWHTFSQFAAVEFGLIAAGLFCIALGWTSLPIVLHRSPPS
jgi:hypothetical protein